MSERPELTVSRVVVEQVIRFAAMEVPGVVRVDRAGPRWRRLVGGSAIRVRVHDRRVNVRLSIVARPGHPLRPICSGVGTAVAGAIERLVGLEVGEIVVLVDGVGV
jgi:uncharacterized alkaline shock family protein YloU